MAEIDRALRRIQRGIPAYAMLDVWLALGGEPDAFDRMWIEDGRTPADTWAQLMAVIRGDSLAADHNPPAGPEFDQLVAGLR
jgi:hypothetical protein